MTSSPEMYSSGSENLIPILGMCLLSFFDEREDDGVDDLLPTLFLEDPGNTLW